MATLSSESLVQTLLELFTEAYEGPRDTGSTWFTNNEPDAALLGTLRRLSAEAASTSLADGSLTAAAHAEHLRWSLAMANGVVRGAPPQFDWAESWTVQTVDPEAWDRLREALRHEYETLREAIATQPFWENPQYLTGVTALIPHAAYHLGAIRQMLPLLDR